MKSSLATLKSMAAVLDARIEVLREVELEGDQICLQRRPNLRRKSSRASNSSPAVNPKPAPIRIPTPKTYKRPTPRQVQTRLLQLERLPDIANLSLAMEDSSLSDSPQRKTAQPSPLSSSERQNLKKLARVAKAAEASGSSTINAAVPQPVDLTGTGLNCGTSKRFCLEVRVLASPEGVESEQAFIDFEGFDPG